MSNRISQRRLASAIELREKLWYEDVRSGSLRPETEGAALDIARLTGQLLPRRSSQTRSIARIALLMSRTLSLKSADTGELAREACSAPIKETTPRDANLDNFYLYKYGMKPSFRAYFTDEGIHPEQHDNFKATLGISEMSVAEAHFQHETETSAGKNLYRGAQLTPEGRLFATYYASEADNVFFQASQLADK